DGVPARWRLRLLLLAALTTAWMVVTVLRPELQSYENASAMTAAPLIFLGVAGAADLIAHRSAIRAAKTPRNRPFEPMALALLAGLLCGTLYLGHAVAPAAASGMQGRELIVA